MEHVRTDRRMSTGHERLPPKGQKSCLQIAQQEQDTEAGSATAKQGKHVEHPAQHQNAGQWDPKRVRAAGITWSRS